MKAKKMDHPNQSIVCEVSNCQYFMTGNYCSADKIQVTPQHANNSGDTDCATFVAQ
jgi:hypothetical protein